MSSGTFQVGETVQGRVINKGLGEEGKDTNPSINFRVAQSNHRRVIITLQQRFIQIILMLMAELFPKFILLHRPH